MSKRVPTVLAGLLALAMTHSAGAAAGEARRLTGDPESWYSHIAPELVANPGNPNHLVVAAGKRTSQAPNNVQFGACQVHVSRDGGQTWKTTTLAVPPGMECRRFQPTLDLAFGKGGQLFVAYFAQQRSVSSPVADPTGPTHATANACGQPSVGFKGNPSPLPSLPTLPSAPPVACPTPEPVPAPSPAPGVTPPDPNKPVEVANPAKGRWVSTTPQGRILVARSDDGGTTFSAPVTVATIQERLGHDLNFAMTPAAGGSTCVGGTSASCVAGAAGLPSVFSFGRGANESADYRDFDLAADPVTGNVYIAWNLGVPGTYSSASVVGGFVFYSNRHRPTWFSRSLDGGTTFSVPYPVYPPKAGLIGRTAVTVAPVLAVAKGTVHLAAAWASCYDAYDWLNDCIGIHTMYTSSKDNGATFDEPVAFAPYSRVNFAGGRFVRTGLAVDPRPDHDNVYVLYEDELDGDNNSTIYLVRSNDGGKTWQKPLAIADERTEYDQPQERPEMSVAPDGRLDIAWYDGRHDVTSGAPCKSVAECSAGRDIYYAYSTDGGATIGPNVRVTPTSFTAWNRQLNDFRAGCCPGGDGLLNSIGIRSTAAGATIVWEQSRKTGGSMPIWDLMIVDVMP